MLPELQLQAVLPYIENVEEFGHRVHVALLRVSMLLISHSVDGRSQCLGSRATAKLIQHFRPVGW